MQIRLICLIFFFSGCTCLFNGCNSIESADNRQTPGRLETAVNPSPTPASVANADGIGAGNNDEDVGEIKSCSPEKVFLGDLLTVSLKVPHGRYSAILRVKDKTWFFLYGENSEPAWNDRSFIFLSEITINTETAFNSTNVEVGKTPEKIFTKTGKYRVMVSREDFGQDDPPWTGMCEVYYENKKRPK